MSTEKIHNELREHLQQLQAEMQAQKLWSASTPDPKALESTVPFMYDTLQLHEWLQWVFIPRLQALMDAKSNLPHQSHIHPLAEHEWEKRTDFDKRQLLLLINRIDATLNGCDMTPSGDEHKH
ncbi:YqcC family protein [Comamonas testosteroni]|uniref:YqcC family protein n=1 Tax=Comamonas testosteroni TaxID=285 RepID=A0A373FP56_COMTE|nr:YqcC family protein [Comamonas testosteroni]RGE45933.1 YqcC family protein [Comamonas testosteroni]